MAWSAFCETRNQALTNVRNRPSYLGQDERLVGVRGNVGQ